jgi:hypothetical protein
MRMLLVMHWISQVGLSAQLNQLNLLVSTKQFDRAEKLANDLYAPIVALALTAIICMLRSTMLRV